MTHDIDRGAKRLIDNADTATKHSSTHGCRWCDIARVDALLAAHADDRAFVRAVVILAERRNESDSSRPLWCPVCRANHTTPIGEATDAGIVTRACPRVPTSDPIYYGSPVYTGDR